MREVPHDFGTTPSKLPWSVRCIAVLTLILIVVVSLELRRLNAGAFLIVLIAVLLAGLAMSVLMAAYWREWRALPLSAVFAILATRGGLEVFLNAGILARGDEMDLLGQILLWASLPMTLIAVAGLWRIFENHARFLNGQRALLEHEGRYRHLIENATDAFYAADEEGRFTLVNAAAARLFGRRAADMTALSFYDLVSDPVANQIREAVAMLKTKDVKAFYHEFQITLRDGPQRWVGQNLQLLTEGRHVRGFQSVLRDITEWRAAQDRLRENELRLRSLFDAMAEGVLQTQADGVIRFSNSAAERILGLTHEDLASCHCADTAWKFLRADGTPMPVKEWVGCVAHTTHAATPRTVTGFRRKDGSTCWLNACAEPMVGKNDQFHGVVITFTDITETKAAEENLRIIEFALDNAIEQVFLTTTEGRLVYANRSAQKALGYTAREILDRTFLDIAPEVTAEDWAETVRRARGGTWPTFEACHVARDGRQYPVSVSVSHVEFNGREYLFAFAHDLSREADLATQLRHAQKLEAIGLLAGGIAHDFNNILSGVLGYADLAMQDTPADNPVRSYLREILAGSHRAADLVRQILAFSRRTEQKRQPINVASLVKEVVSLLRGSLPATIAIEQAIDADCRPVLGDPVQIHQVVMNLCTNAYHAMRDKGGVLSVAVREVTAGSEWTAAEVVLNPGSYVGISVSDTGCGMDAETRRRIFEPFFTTKKPGEGTGLGLATVRGIVKSHRGGIRLESEPGRGTRFEVLLPVCLPGETGPSVVPGDTSRPQGRETILFMDDEEAIRTSVATGLRRLGYTVETAPEGESALALFMTTPDRFDLIVTDQTMPRLTGFDMARKILRVKQSQRILLGTGFAENLTRDSVLAAGFAGFVEKPYDFAALSQVVRRTLDMPSPA